MNMIPIDSYSTDDALQDISVGPDGYIYLGGDETYKPLFKVDDIPVVKQLRTDLSEARQEVGRIGPVFNAATMLVKKWQEAGHVDYIEMICDSADETDYDAQDLAELMLAEQVRKLEERPPTPPSTDQSQREGGVG